MQQQPIIHSIDSPHTSSSISVMLGIFILVVATIAGIGTGYGIKAFTSTNTKSMLTTGSSSKSGSNEKVSQSAGIKDEKTFSDKAEGILQEGGIEGEGAYHLERAGGDSQTAYLTSTTVDLEPYIGKKVRVLGKTFQGKVAGWLMDVGYVEVLQ